jgi:hypothetical protein
MKDLNAPESAIQYDIQDSDGRRTKILTTNMSFQRPDHRRSRGFEAVLHRAIV